MRHQAHGRTSDAYREFTPPESLSDYIEACWFYGPTFKTSQKDILIPEGVVDVVFNVGDPYLRQRALDEKDAAWCPDDIVVGQRSELFLVEWPAQTRLFAVRLRPEAAATFFHFPLNKITNKTVRVRETAFAPLSDIIRQRAFNEHSLVADNCFAFLRNLVSGRKRPDMRLAAAISRIRQSEGKLDIQSLCDELALGRRTLERLFLDKVGVSPKFYAQTVRLHHFLYLQQHRDADLVSAALDAQYYDQSHLIRDFRKFTGESPARFFNAPPGIYEPLLASLVSRRKAEAARTL